MLSAPADLFSRPEATTSRWIPLRAGIIGVHHYDVQEFRFHQGRLLLRGENGSGKSVAMEILLPFLLDASLAAERMSTFGGRSRTVHWKLIGFDQTGRSNARGYVWLEFGRIDDQGRSEYFTIGAGLEAQREDTKSTHAWYFSTRARVGDGLDLCTPNREALSSADLANALGDRGTVYPNAGQYRDAVNATLYGLNDAQYAALRRMLLELRRPQLSQGLNDTKLSSLLSDSLPPPDQDVIRPMVAGFESLGRHNDELDRLQRTRRAVEALSTAVADHARITARGTALALSAAVKAHTQALRTEAHRQADTTKTAEALNAAMHDIEVTAKELASMQGDLEGLQGSTAYQAGRELDTAHTASTKAQDALSAARVRLDQAERRRDLLKTAHAEDAASLEQSRQALQTSRTTLDELARGLAMGTLVDELAAHAEDGRYSAVEETAERSVAAMRAPLEALQSISARHQAATEALAKATRAEDTAAEDLGDAMEEAAQLAEQTEEALEDFIRASAEWLHAHGVSVDAIEPLNSAGALTQLVRDTLGERQADAHTRLGTQQAELARTEKTKDELKQALRTLVTEEDSPSPRPGDGDHSSPGQALWQLVDFQDEVPLTDRAALEAALEAIGILDAWLPDDPQEPCHDKFLTQGTPLDGNGNLAEVLRPIEGPQQERVAELLRCIGYAPTGDALPAHVVSISSDGRYTYSPVSGHSAKDHAEYIGASARDARRRSELGAAEAELGRVERQTASTARKIAAIRAEIEALKDEAATAPSQNALTLAEARQSRQAAVIDERTRARTAAQADMAVAAQRHRTSQAALEAAALSTGLPSEKAPTGLLALGAIDRAIGSWVHAHRTVRTGTEAVGRSSENVREATALLEQAQHDVAEAETAATAAAAHLDSLTRSIGADHAEVMSQIRELRERISASTAHTARLQDARADAVSAHTMAQANQEHAAAKVLGQASALADAAARLHTLIILGVIEGGELLPCLDAEPTETERPDLTAITAPAPGWTCSRLAAIADRITVATRSISHSASALDKARTRLNDARIAAERELPEDLALHQRTAEGVDILHATFERVPYDSLSQLANELLKQAEAMTSVLQQGEHELFEAFLAGRVRQEVSARIRAASKLNRDINQLLLGCATNTGIVLRLEWSVHPDFASNAEAIALLESEDALDVRQRQVVADFFRDLIHKSRTAQSPATTSRVGTGTEGWTERLMAALDYRTWHAFELQSRRGAQSKFTKLTGGGHGAMSGGEKAVALHLALFAAAAGHYLAADRCPRLILLDEVLVGVDPPMRGKVFSLLSQLDLDLLATSESEPGMHPGMELAIYQLVPGPEGSQTVCAYPSVWSGGALYREPDAVLA